MLVTVIITNIYYFNNLKNHLRTILSLAAAKKAQRKKKATSNFNYHQQSANDNNFDTRNIVDTELYRVDKPSKYRQAGESITLRN
jgi:hypothetical protein